MIRTTGVAKMEITPHQPRKSVVRKYSLKYLSTQVRQRLPLMRLWKKNNIAPMC
jgi:hypothetical protein